MSCQSPREGRRGPWCHSPVFVPVLSSLKQQLPCLAAARSITWPRLALATDAAHFSWFLPYFPATLQLLFHFPFSVSFSSHCGHLGFHTGCSKPGPFALRLRETLDVSGSCTLSSQRRNLRPRMADQPHFGCVCVCVCVCVRSPSLHCRDSVNLVVLQKLPLGLYSHCLC